MDIRTVLEQIETDKRSENMTSKLYRYMGLMQTIEHFSQKLERDQIMSIAWESVNELLTVAQSALFVRVGEQMPIRSMKGLDLKGWGIPLTESLRNMALLNTDIVTKPKAIRAMLGDRLYEAMSAQAIILFITDDMPEGMVVVGEKSGGGSFNDDDAIILESLMRLTNNALENNCRLGELESLNRQMDAKVFNLFAINQATHALMRETSVEALSALAIDAFSELTRSMKTGFFLRDADTGCQVLRAYRDVMNPDERAEMLLCASDANLGSRTVFDLAEPAARDEFDQLFPDGSELVGSIGGRHVVMLEQLGNVPGMVTLGEKTNGEPYTQEQFQLIESLAASICIAIANASMINELSRQKEDLKRRVDRLLSLSTLIKNINSCGNEETLLELTGRTLTASFGVKCGMILLYDADAGVFRIVRKLNVQTNGDEIEVEGNWRSVLDGNLVCEGTQAAARAWLPESLIPDFSEADGIVVEPIYYTDIRRVVLGAIVVLSFGDTDIRSAESLLTMEAIANHVSLVMTSLRSIERERRFQLPNHVERFKRELKLRIEKAAEDGAPFEMVLVTDRRGYVFRENNLAERLEGHYDHVYPVAHNEVFVMQGDAEGDLLRDITRMLEEEEADIRLIRFGSDFHDFKGFFELFRKGGLLG